MFFPCKGTVLSHDHAPDILFVKIEVIVFRDVRRLDENAEIQQSFVQTFCHVGGIPAVKVKMDIRIRFTQFFYDLGNLVHGPCLSAADIDISAYRIFRRGKLGLCLINHGYDFLRPFPEAHSVGSEAYIVAFSHEELHAQFFFQIFDLSG